MTEPVAPTRPSPGGRPVVPTRGRLAPLGLGEISLLGGFWGDRQSINGQATLDHCAAWMERLGWFENLRAVARGTVAEDRRGREFVDSDVFKLAEAMAWEAGRTDGATDAESRTGQLAHLIGQAVEPDGYLNSNFGHPGQAPRYSDLAWGHELYGYGHLLQAVIARTRTAEGDGFLQVGRRVADHVVDVFGPSGMEAVCGHPGIEMALVELARLTSDERYLEQADLFVDRRGRHLLPEIEFGPEYFQDDTPVRAARSFRGHAVRALYLACGVVDVAVETSDSELLDTVRRQFARTVAAQTYLTGGMGAHHQDEAFGRAFVLPPDRAYSETCAGVAAMMLCWRLLLATGEMHYGDVAERILFNVIAASPDPTGTRFFYTNTLHQRQPGTWPEADRESPRAASTLRAPWFTVSCCPTNVARTLASLACYVATRDDHGIQIHQFASADLSTRLADGREVALRVRTDYPWDGDITVKVVESTGPWQLTFRVPGWAGTSARVEVNGESHPAPAGVCMIERVFHPGDTIVLQLPVRARWTRPDPRIDAVRGSVAVERGPLVYCTESIDLAATGKDTTLDDIEIETTGPLLDSSIQLPVPMWPDGDERPTVVARGRRRAPEDHSWPYRGDLGDLDQGISPGSAPAPPAEETDLVLVPYHAWGNRGPSAMRVWIPISPPDHRPVDR